MSSPFEQQQFLTVIDRDEAERRFRAALDLTPLEGEQVALAAALGRVLVEDIVSPVDVPGFDRSNVDGFAVRAADTFGASEDRPVRLRLLAEMIATGVTPSVKVAAGCAAGISTGGMLPRGADAVVMIEHTDVAGEMLVLTRPVSPGGNVSFAGSDIGRGETVLYRGTQLTSRETGVLAAIGVADVAVVRRPRVAILSTGDELVPPGEPLPPGHIYDSNATVLADAVRELGGEAVPMGIVPDDLDRLRRALRAALACDAVLLSGGTSKGAGDVSYRIVGEFGPPGVIAHGVALKPGKPLCLAVINLPSRRPIPVAVLPGFPTSAVFTFHEFVAPVLRRMAGRPPTERATASARLAFRVNSERGRTEYLLVGLVHCDAGLTAYPMGKGSGSVTEFGRADGFITIPRQHEYVESGATVDVQLIGAGVEPADLVVIGSHCIGLDYLLSRLHERGVRVKFLAVGSTGGLEAVRRGECDLAGVHLLDPVSGEHNRPFLTDGMKLLAGYGRKQGVVFRPADARFAERTLEQVLEMVRTDPDCLMVNRNRGSGTRVLIDQMLDGARPAGYLSESRSHNAVAAAVAQGRADWGLAIAQAATGLGFLPVRDEIYDFVVPTSRWDWPGVRAFRELLADSTIRSKLVQMGFVLGEKDE